jgi:hypothetical protein
LEATTSVLAEEIQGELENVRGEEEDGVLKEGDEERRLNR